MIIPFLIICFVAAMFGTHMRSAYGYPLWFFLGVYLILRFQHRDNVKVFRWTLCWIFLAVLVLATVFIFQAVDPEKEARRYLPMRAIGAECDRIWSSRFNLPCPYTTGQWVLAGTAAYAMKDRPSVHFYNDTINGDTIADMEALPVGTWSTDKDINQLGGIILWEISQSSEQLVPDWVHRRFPRAEVLPEILKIPYKTSPSTPLLNIGVAIVPPPERP
jgi:hypothetical protein